MTCFRTNRGLAALASLAVLCAGPHAALAEMPTSSASAPKISTRFLDSLEQAEPPSSSLARAGELRPRKEPRRDDENDLMHDEDRSGRRLSWWSIALQLVHPPCPPPDHHQPPHCHGHGSDGGGSGGGGSGGDGSSGADGGGDGEGAGGEGGDYSANGSTADGGGSGSTSTTDKKALASPGALPFWSLLAAAFAAAAAIAAVVVGSRRKPRGPAHPLHGSLERRMRLFGGFSDGMSEGRELSPMQAASLEEREGETVV